jgi:transposase
VTTDESGRAELVSKLAAHQIAGIVLEATGGLERAVMSELEAAGYQTRRVNPVQIRHLPELGQLSAKQIAALVGVAPFNHDRGKWRGQRRIQGGRKELRSLLYMAAMCAVQHNSVFRDHYAQLLKRGKPRKVARVACIRKLLGILNAMLRTNQPWCDQPVPPAGLSPT